MYNYLNSMFEEVHESYHESAESIFQTLLQEKPHFSGKDEDCGSLLDLDFGRSEFELERSSSEESFKMDDQIELGRRHSREFDHQDYLLNKLEYPSRSSFQETYKELSEVVDQSWLEQLSMNQERSVVEEPKEIQDFQPKPQSQFLEVSMPKIEMNDQPERIIATVEQRFRNLFVLNEIPAVYDCPFLDKAIYLLIDKNLRARGEEIGVYPLEKKKSTQLTNKVNGFVRKEIQSRANPNIQTLNGEAAEQVQRLLDTADLTKDSRNTLLSNEELFSLVFTQEFFVGIFAKLEEKSSSMLKRLVAKAEPAMSNPNDRALADRFVSDCAKEGAKLPFTRMENYCSIILYLEDLLYGLRLQGGTDSQPKISIISNLKAHFEQGMQQEGMNLPDDVQYPTNKQRNKKSEKGADYKAFLIITHPALCHPPIQLPY